MGHWVLSNKALETDVKRFLLGSLLFQDAKAYFQDT